MGSAEINIAPVPPAAGSAGSVAGAQASKLTQASSVSSFASVLQAAQHVSASSIPTAAIAFAPDPQAQIEVCSAIPASKSASKISANPQVPSKTEMIPASNQKSDLSLTPNPGLDQAKPASLGQTSSEPAVVPGGGATPPAGTLFAERSTAEQVAEPSRITIAPFVAQAKNGTPAMHNKPFPDTVPEKAAQELTPAKDEHSIRVHRSQADGRAREKNSSAESGSAVTTGPTAAAVTADQVVPAQDLLSQTVPSLVAVTMPQPAPAIESVPQVPAPGRPVKAPSALISQMVVSNTPAQPASSDKPKEPDSILKNGVLPFPGQSAHSGEHEELHPVTAKNDARTGSFSDLLTHTQAQPVLAQSGEGASFSLSLGGSFTHARDTAAPVPAAGSVSRAVAPGDLLLQTAATSTPVTRLEVAVQDPVLGTVGVHAEMRSGVLHASLSGTQEAIGASLSSLHHYLQEQQVSVSSLSFNAHAERVNGTGTASGAGDFMRGGTGANTSSSPERQEQRAPQERQNLVTVASSGEVSRTGGTAVSRLAPGQAAYVPAGSTLSIHI